MEPSLLGQQFIVAIMASHLMETLKNQSWFPFMQANLSKMNRVFAALVAIITAIGVHATFSAHDGTLVITGLTAGTILHGSWAAIQQYALQHFCYKVAIKNKEPL